MSELTHCLICHYVNGRLNTTGRFIVMKVLKTNNTNNYLIPSKISTKTLFKYGPHLRSFVLYNHCSRTSIFDIRVYNHTRALIWIQKGLLIFKFRCYTYEFYILKYFWNDKKCEFTWYCTINIINSLHFRRTLKASRKIFRLTKRVTDIISLCKSLKWLWKVLW